MEKIKLVVWDLDETFWKGTLSEGEVQIINENVEIIKELAKRGIMNSISSKNDYQPAKALLEEVGIWDYFIFPSINWTPKGENVKHIIEECQLRSPNVLFVDDNISNRKEVEHYNQGIWTVSEVEIPQLLNMPELKGKDDSNLSRLKQYKILEEKAKVKESYSDNHSFLLESQIKIQFLRNTQEYRDRILELINRTNQLNFTKVRLDDEEIDTLLKSPTLENVCIHVEDKFGDYGVCGFYSLDKKNHHLEHFLFSCRILNLGIENYVYQKLGKPTIDIILPVAGDISTEETIDWIKEQNERAVIEKKVDEKSNRTKLKLLFLGGCDLEQMCHYIDGRKFDVYKEFNYPNSKGVPVHREHTVYLRELESLSEKEKAEIYALPFGDEKMFKTQIFSNKFDVLVYSALMNYTHEVYSNKYGKFKVAYGGYLNQDELCEYLKLTKTERERFVSQYTYEGLQSPEDFKDDLIWLSDSIKKPIVIINGSETDGVCEKEPLASARHKTMNNAVKDLVRNNPSRFQLLDVTKFVKDKSDHNDTIRHYQRQIYVKMAEELMTILTKENVPVRKSAIIIERLTHYEKRLKSLVIRIINKLRIF